MPESLYALELASLVVRGFEDQSLDYKGPGNWNDWGSSQKAELVRDMIAMANSDRPGWIIIGVAQDATGRFQPVGLSEEAAASFDHTAVGSKVKRHADPEVNFTVHGADADGHRFVAIRVEPFDTVPHVCKASSGTVLDEGGFYIRTRAAQTSKVTTAQQMRALIDRATQVHADTMVSRIRELVDLAQPPGDAGPGSGSFQDESARARRRAQGEP